MWTFIKQDEPKDGVVICHFTKDGMERNTGIDGTIDVQTQIDSLIGQWEIEDAAVIADTVVEEIV